MSRPRAAIVVTGSELVRGERTDRNGPFYAREALSLGLVPEHILIVGDDPEALADFVRPMVALYVGGMGARGRNFYNDLACRYGYEAAAKEVQDLYLDGKKREAAAAVPFELIDATSLIGPRERIAERVGRYADAGVTTLTMSANAPRIDQRLEMVRMMAELVG